MKKKIIFNSGNEWDVKSATLLFSFFDGHIVRIDPTLTYYDLFTDKKISIVQDNHVPPYYYYGFGRQIISPIIMPKYWVKFTKFQMRMLSSGRKQELNLEDVFLYHHFQTFKQALLFVLKIKINHWMYPITKYYDRYSRQK